MTWLFPIPVSIMDLNCILNPTKSTFICDLCGKNFLKKCSLYRHKRNVHSLHSPCGFCKKGLKLKSRPYAYKTHLLRCSMFNAAFPNMSPKELTTTAEQYSMCLRQKNIKEDKLQENSPIEDKQMTFPKNPNCLVKCNVITFKLQEPTRSVNNQLRLTIPQLILK